LLYVQDADRVTCGRVESHPPGVELRVRPFIGSKENLDEDSGCR
jgi:hypothetical protein